MEYQKEEVSFVLQKDETLPVAEIACAISVPCHLIANHEETASHKPQS